MRIKMSPRRALATAVVMALIPSLIFLVSVDRFSIMICDQINGELQIAEGKKEHLDIKCMDVLTREKSSLFYWILITSVFINWPIVRWLDDLQWYKEWMRK